MMEIDQPNYRFCPFCGSALVTRMEEDRERRYCAKCDWTYYPRVAASVSAIICDDRHVLLVKRRRNPFKGTWMFPSGFVDLGEHPDEALSREIKEETGLALQRSHLLGVFQSEDDPREYGHFVFFYTVAVSRGAIQTDPSENEDIRWFAIEAVNESVEIAWKLHKHFMEELRSGRLASLVPKDTWMQ